MNMFFRDKLLGIALCSIGVGMVVIIVIPPGWLAVTLACIIFICGLSILRRC